MRKIKGIIDSLKEPNITVPEILYKYYSFNNYTHRVFENNEIYFSSPVEFNDPFDSKIRFIFNGSKTQRKHFYNEASLSSFPDMKRKEMLNRRKRILNQKLDLKCVPEGSQKKYMDIRNHMGIFCMTEDKENILMWSHYAKYHTGICLGFGTEKTFFSYGQKVQYKEFIPFINSIELLEQNKNEVKENFITSLLTKAKDWEYEKEWRLVKINGVGVKKYPEESLECVILGCKISSDNKKKIIEWCNSRKHKPTLYQAKEKESEFGLDIIPIE